MFRRVDVFDDDSFDDVLREFNGPNKTGRDAGIAVLHVPDEPEEGHPGRVLRGSVPEHEQLDLRVSDHAVAVQLLQEDLLELHRRTCVVPPCVQEVKQVPQLAQHLLLLQRLIQCLNTLRLVVLYCVQRIL